jgi:4a-hydroxytetrahydrobiopterin dehydratase
MSSPPTSTERVYTDAEILAYLQLHLPLWTFEAGHLRRLYKTADWNASLKMVNAIGPLAEAASHHPDIELGYGKVQVNLMTHSAGGITDKDFDLAGKIEQRVAAT